MEKLKKGKSAKKDLDGTKKLETVRFFLLGENCALSQWVTCKMRDAGKSGNLKCGEFGEGQKYGVTCKVRGDVLRR